MFWHVKSGYLKWPNDWATPTTNVDILGNFTFPELEED
jgi:hypothetical protein